MKSKLIHVYDYVDNYSFETDIHYSSSLAEYGKAHTYFVGRRLDITRVVGFWSGIMPPSVSSVMCEIRSYEVFTLTIL